MVQRLNQSDSRSDGPVDQGRSQVSIRLGPASGYTRDGLPYNRFGHGRRIAVIFQGLLFENKPLKGFTEQFFRSMYKFLEDEYTYFIVLRRPHLPEGFSMRDMSNDYASMVQEEFLGPVDVIGQSTGGSIAQHFAADHPELVRNLVLHSTADRLSAKAKAEQLRMAAFARRHQWARAYAAGLAFMFPVRGIGKYAAKPVLWLGSFLAARMAVPKDSADLVVTVEAEDKHDFKGRLHEIHAPTLLVAGDQDPFYSKELFEETAAGIPNCRLILYKGMGHPASGKEFARDVSDFLKTGSGDRVAAARDDFVKEISPWLL